MSTTKPPLTAADLVERAKNEMTSIDGNPKYATAFALTAIADLLQVSMGDAFASGVVAGGEATAGALATIFNITAPTTTPSPDDPPKLFMPNEGELMAARGGIIDLITSVALNRLQPTPDVLDGIIKAVVLSLRWRPQ